MPADAPQKGPNVKPRLVIRVNGHRVLLDLPLWRLLHPPFDRLAGISFNPKSVEFVMVELIDSKETTIRRYTAEDLTPPPSPDDGSGN
jgi:hypothetical protein